MSAPSPRHDHPVRSGLMTAAQAVAIGLVCTLLLVIASIAIALAGDHSLQVPGVMTYTSTSTSMSMHTSPALPLTWLLLTALVGLPAGMALGRLGPGHDHE